MKNIYIHMGCPKSGSSALQKFLNDNRDVLNSYRIIYPHAGKTVSNAINHFRLYFCFQKQDHFLCPKDIGTPWEEWGKILKEARGSNNDLLVSSEAFISLSYEYLEWIKTEIGEYYNIKPVIYLRRIDDFIISWYGQIIKEEEHKNILSLKFKNSFSFSQKIKNIINVFGKNNIIIRPYEFQQFRGGNIFKDFVFHVFKRNSIIEFKIPDGQVNPSLSPDALEYKRLVNKLPFSLKEKQLCLPGLLRYSNDYPGNLKDHLSPKERLDLIQNEKNFYEWIAKELLGRKDGQLFFSQIPSPDDSWKPYKGLSTDKAILITKYILDEHFKNEVDGNEIFGMINQFLIQSTMDKLSNRHNFDE